MIRDDRKTDRGRLIIGPRKRLWTIIRPSLNVGLEGEGEGERVSKSRRGVICGERLEDEIAPQDQAGSVLRQGD